MSTEILERAFASTRRVLENVQPEQLDDPTPCASWRVRDLIGHIVGGSHWFAASVEAGASPDNDTTEDDDYAAGDFVGAFDQGVKASVAAFGAPGAQEKVVQLPFGAMPGGIFMGIATMDTFTHGWDLAKATGQSTDLDPELAGQLLEQAKMAIPDQFRGEEGKAPFAAAREAPEGATNADRLAAFLGRAV